MKSRDRNLSALTPTLAEHILWHAQGHLANNREVCCSEHMTRDTKEAMDILWLAINRVTQKRKAGR